MTLNPTIAGLDLPHLDSTHKLQRVLNSALMAQLPLQGTAKLTSAVKSPHGQSNLAVQAPVAEAIYWDASYFKLHRVNLFEAASAQEQAAILKRANQALFEEAYLIEKAGMGYMAKMVLLAESTEERMLYGLFTADETSHFSQICQFVPADGIHTDNAFLRLVEELAESSDKRVLLFVIQVVLEGWGLSHYRSLAEHCRDRAFSQVLQGFLQAEARHHGTGATLFNQSSISASSQAAIVEVLARFLQMVQVGPQSVVDAIAQVIGPLSRSQTVQVLEELDTETHSGLRLKRLRSLMQGEAARAIVQTLDDQALFQPLPAQQCV